MRQRCEKHTYVDIPADRKPPTDRQRCVRKQATWYRDTEGEIERVEYIFKKSTKTKTTDTADNTKSFRSPEREAQRVKEKEGLS